MTSSKPLRRRSIIRSGRPVFQTTLSRSLNALDPDPKRPDPTPFPEPDPTPFPPQPFPPPIPPQPAPPPIPQLSSVEDGREMFRRGIGNVGLEGLLVGKHRIQCED